MTSAEVPEIKETKNPENENLENNAPPGEIKSSTGETPKTNDIDFEDIEMEPTQD